ncbi:DEAD/DEAH box helicase [Candidatus Falkowbacteria bacterium]|nr:DEAD/DEAH box helicase [Candidatus Falkowbacteria bacterium]
MNNSENLRDDHETVNDNQQPANSQGFFGMGIAPELLDVLTKMHFTTPTPIQAQAIPVALQGKDVMGIAQTGTGKTLAFGVPLIQHALSAGSKGLILVPTRELALQVYELLTKVTRHFKLQTALVIGGRSMGEQRRDLSRKPDIIIATPGRLIDHVQSRTANLSNITTVVLDEADRMLDMGFEPQIKTILQSVAKDRTTMLFSATMPPEIARLATSYMQLPVRVEVARVGSTATLVQQELIFARRNEKLSILYQILEEYKGSVLIFCRTKYNVKNLATILRKKFTVAEIHSQKTLNQRITALEGFKKGRFRILIATDIAARGIHVNNIELVINYELPDNPDDYVHRIGRTGRAGKAGHAIAFALPEQKSDVKRIERLIQKALPIKKVTLTQEQMDSVAREIQEMRDAQGGNEYRADSGRTEKRFGRGGFGGSRGGFKSGFRSQKSGFGHGSRNFKNQDRKPMPYGREPEKFNNYNSEPKSIEQEAFGKASGVAPQRKSFGAHTSHSGQRRNWNDKPAHRGGFKKRFGSGDFAPREGSSDTRSASSSYGDKKPYGERKSFSARNGSAFGEQKRTGGFGGQKRTGGFGGKKRFGGFSARGGSAFGGGKRTGGFGGPRKSY